MKLDITQQLYGPDGEPLKYPVWNDPPTKKDGSPVLDEEGRPLKPTMRPEKFWDRFMTLKSIMWDSLSATLEDDKGTSGEDKIKVYDLGMRLRRAEEKMEVDVDELKLIRERVNKTYSSPFLVAQVWKMLENLESVKDAKEDGAGAKASGKKKGS